MLAKTDHGAENPMVVSSFGESWTADDTEVVPPNYNQYASGHKSVILFPWRAGLCPGRVSE